MHVVKAQDCYCNFLLQFVICNTSKFLKVCYFNDSCATLVIAVIVFTVYFL